jgi:heme A synthase
MIGTGPIAPDGRTSTDSAPEEESTSNRPVTTLRGARVEVDPRRAAQWVLGACLVALAVVAVVLVIAGIHKNAQADTLQRHGVSVNVTVTGCLGLLGGSGSNGAGYACKGTYTFDGRHYRQDIPGNSLLPPGSVIRGVTVPDDPYLLSTPGLVAAQQPSWKVYIAPAVLLAVFVVTLALLVAIRRRRRTPASTS